MRRIPRTSSKWLTLVAACLGLGMLMIDTFVVNVAFPAIGRSLHASLSSAQWTVSGYVLAVGVLPVAMGRAGDIFGRRRIYLAGLILFLVASAASGTSQTIEQLIIFRVLQGVGAATMMPGTLSIITQAFPPQQRGLAIGIWGGVSGLGLIAGPILGGLLVHGDSWRWIFYINLPIGVAALAMALLFVPESRDESAPRSLDLAGVALLSAPLLLVMYAITRANDLGWTSPEIVGCFIGAAVLVPMFVITERRVPNPLIDLSLYWRPVGYSAALVVGDALTWEGASREIIGLIDHFAEWPQLLLRAVLFRIVVNELARRAEPERADLSSEYERIVALVLLAQAV